MQYKCYIRTYIPYNTAPYNTVPGLHTGFGTRGGQIELPEILGAGGTTIQEFIGVQRPGGGEVL